MIIMAATFIACFIQGAETNTPVVVIPKGVIAATKEQLEFLDKLKTMTVGVSQDAVLKTLGSPTETNATTWVYRLIEDSHEGGYYVHANLNFGTNGLSGGNVAFGHMTLSERKEK